MGNVKHLWHQALRIQSFHNLYEILYSRFVKSAGDREQQSWHLWQHWTHALMGIWHYKFTKQIHLDWRESCHSDSGVDQNNRVYLKTPWIHFSSLAMTKPTKLLMWKLPQSQSKKLWDWVWSRCCSWFDVTVLWKLRLFQTKHPDTWESEINLRLARRGVGEYLPA